MLLRSRLRLTRPVLYRSGYIQFGGGYPFLVVNSFLISLESYGPAIVRDCLLDNIALSECLLGFSGVSSGTWR